VRFEFATAGQIIFGDGVAARAGELAAAFGSRALVVTGARPERAQAVLARLHEHGIATMVVQAVGEPSVPHVRLAATQARESGCELVVAIGGGSALDLGKAVAALLANGGDVLDYAEVIGPGRKLQKPSVPLVALPTTAGTGAEVTRNAVVQSPEHGVKVSLRSFGMLPRVALVDPELTLSMPPAVTASTGLDALTQLIEPFVCTRANPLTDSICRQGIRAAARSLRRAYDDGSDREARRDMALASLSGGLALANAGLGAVHGFAGPLGGLLRAPHGVLCARLLPFVMETNLAALRARQTQSEAARRYDEVAQILTGLPQARAEDGVAWVRELCVALRVPALREHGLQPDHYEVVARKSEVASSMQANPIKLTRSELVSILEAAS
jgi:alcohol dehydrogenase class IV